MKTRKLAQQISSPRFAWILISLTPVLVDCSGAQKLARIPGCPDTTSVEAIAKVDWASELSVNAKVGARVKAGLQAAVSLHEFAAEIDGELKAACSDIADDLGADGDYENGEDACKAAAKAIGDAKAKLGGRAKVVLAFTPPVCSASMDAMADCAASCKADVSPGEVKVRCEPGKLSGTCTGKCSGSCDMSARAECSGTCTGSCSGEFTGT